MAERVWDRFLTEQDKAHLGTKPPRGVGYGKRPAFLMIDLYRWVYGDEPQPLLESIKQWPGSCGMNGWNALPHTQRLLATAREVGIPVIHVTGMDDIEAGVMGWSDAAHNTPPRLDLLDPSALDRRRRRHDIVDELAPIPGEAVIHKTAPSAFWGTPLLGHLNYLGVDTLICAGESTSGCLRASVVDGCSYRFKMIVVEECAFDRHEACHAINLFDMHQKYADVVSIDNAITHLQSLKAGNAESNGAVEPALAGSATRA